MQLLKKFKDHIKRLKAEAQVLIVASTDQHTPWTAKLLIGITVGYLLSPIDLIPGFIPIIGLLDDLIIVPLLIIIVIKLIPLPVLTDARQFVRNNPKTLKKTKLDFCSLHYRNLVSAIVLGVRAFQIPVGEDP